MYVLFALLAAAIVYLILLIVLRRARMAPNRSLRLAVLSALVLLAALVAFNLASRAVGVDLCPGRPVSYNIPFDYLARGTWGTLALLFYALACLSPAIAARLVRWG